MKGGALLLRLVPRPGLEPGWVSPLVFETSASTDSAIWAFAGAKLQIKIKKEEGTMKNFKKKCLFLSDKDFFRNFVGDLGIKSFEF